MILEIRDRQNFKFYEGEEIEIIKEKEGDFFRVIITHCSAAIEYNGNSQRTRGTIEFLVGDRQYLRISNRQGKFTWGWYPPKYYHPKKEETKMKTKTKEEIIKEVKSKPTFNVKIDDVIHCVNKQKFINWMKQEIEND